MASPTPKRRWYQFSLKTLLVVVSVGIIILGLGTGLYRWAIEDPYFQTAMGLEDALPHESEIESITARKFDGLPKTGELSVPKEYWKQILAGFRSARRMKSQKLVHYGFLTITTTDGKAIRVGVFAEEFEIDDVYYQGGNASEVESVLRAIVSEQERKSG